MAKEKAKKALKEGNIRDSIKILFLVT